MLTAHIARAHVFLSACAAECAMDQYQVRAEWAMSKYTSGVECAFDKYSNTIEQRIRVSQLGSHHHDLQIAHASQTGT